VPANGSPNIRSVSTVTKIAGFMENGSPSGETGETDPPAAFVIRLQELGKRGYGKSWQCPAHDDQNPSLAIGYGGKGQLLLHCHAGCAPEAVLAAVGWTWKDTYPPEARTGERPRTPIAELERRCDYGLLTLGTVELGEMPADATPEMWKIAEDIRYLLELAYGDGDYRPLPYSARFAAGRMGWQKGHMEACRALQRLVKAGVIQRVPNPTKRTGLYAPPPTRTSASVAAVAKPLTSPVEVQADPPVEVLDEAGVDGTESIYREDVGMIAARHGALPVDRPSSLFTRTALNFIHLENSRP
jgi:hypothetical protein